jgi:hypothetical protein
MRCILSIIYGQYTKVPGNVGSLDAGGIWNQGTLTITNSTISGNTAGSGGGIYAAAGTTVNISNSTLSGNFRGTSGEGGAVYAASTATIKLKNTIVANSEEFPTRVQLFSDGFETVPEP